MSQFLAMRDQTAREEIVWLVARAEDGLNKCSGVVLSTAGSELELLLLLEGSLC